MEEKAKSAVTLKRPYMVCKTDLRKRHLFQAKYLRICLTNTSSSEDDTTVGETSIITDVFYEENKKVRKVVSSIAKQHDYCDIL